MGFEPSQSTVLTSDFFVENNVKNVLIPGIGYGRNAQIFIENGMTVTGIEISQTAIDLAYKHFGNNLTIFTNYYSTTNPGIKTQPANDTMLKNLSPHPLFKIGGFQPAYYRLSIERRIQADFQFPAEIIFDFFDGLDVDN